jgi:DNA invertase Pin-like site-specific DNA recombinase
MGKHRRPRGADDRAVALIRVSTEDQRLGPKAQRDAIEMWAKRENVAIVAWRIEQGVSGATPVNRREGLLGAIDDLARLGAGRLVVAKRDRLARDVVLCAMIESLVERNGARVYAADGTGVATGPEGVLMRGIVDLFAQYERLIIGARTRAALDAKRSRAERTGAIPFGFRLADDEKHLVVCEREQRVIAFIRDLRDDGLSIRAIVAECARRGMVSRTQRPFGKTQIERVLRKNSAAIAEVA